jgi:hypothetical protein
VKHAPLSGKVCLTLDLCNKAEVRPKELRAR